MCYSIDDISHERGSCKKRGGGFEKTDYEITDNSQIRWDILRIINTTDQTFALKNTVKKPLL